MIERTGEKHSPSGNSGGSPRVQGQMRARRWLAIAVLAAPLSLSGMAAAGGLGPRDGGNLSPTDLDRVRVGDPAPDFTLESETGVSITLSDFRRRANVVLVFYRGRW